MYLSRVEVDVNNRCKIKDLTHLGAYHNWVESSFPEEFNEELRTRKLWRLDKLYGKLYLLIVSQSKPNLTCLERYGVKGTAVTKDYEHFLNTITNGKKYRFRAVLNPVHSVPQPDEKRGKVCPEITVGQQLKFFEKRAAKYGFQLVPDEYSITERGYGVLKKKGNNSVRLCKAAYEGSLIVIDADTFKDALIKGIGKKKAYGFGMMTVIPERD
ncbi:MAG: type I-E CRISPR-associated protein Cas6/Cse3/CasE [Lachnospiraceae bacterium]|jgi:CRISPR system Cascade subunit CasE|nr:type I-E CRISPR-associated protein Cas6/Cse3/CasE [Lachnospiraceae bacterium]